jgi:hypothetical protein
MWEMGYLGWFQSNQTANMGNFIAGRMRIRNSERQSRPGGLLMRRTTWNRGFTLLIGALLIGLIGTVAAAPREPFWKIGRAVIQYDAKGQKELLLRLSLRNEGNPGKTPVQILGRWKQGRESKFILLVRLTTEVELKQTAIGVVSLKPLEPVPLGRPSLELLVVTGTRETDQTIVPLP